MEIAVSSPTSRSPAPKSSSVRNHAPCTKFRPDTSGEFPSKAVRISLDKKRTSCDSGPAQISFAADNVESPAQSSKSNVSKPTTIAHKHEGLSGKSDRSLTQEEAKKLSKRFSQRLVCNRLSARRTSNPNTNCSINFSFAPKIGAKSNQLAVASRDKLIRKANVSVVGRSPDILALRDVISERDREELKMSKNSKELKECTFRPKINSRPGSSKPSPIRSSRGRKQDDKPSDLCEFEKNRSQFTFKPAINKSPNSKPGTKNLTTKVRGAEKSVERAWKGRKERERVASMMGRGYGPQNVQRITREKHMANCSSSSTSAQKLESKLRTFLSKRKYSAIPLQPARPKPLVIPDDVTPVNAVVPPASPFSLPGEEGDTSNICIDINIGQGISEKLYIGEGVDVDAAVEKVSQKHGLQDAAKKKLADAIKHQLSA